MLPGALGWAGPIGQRRIRGGAWSGTTAPGYPDVIDDLTQDGTVLRCPPVTTISNGRPARSTPAWILVLRPPGARQVQSGSSPERPNSCKTPAPSLRAARAWPCLSRPGGARLIVASTGTVQSISLAAPVSARILTSAVSQVPSAV